MSLAILLLKLLVRERDLVARRECFGFRRGGLVVGAVVVAGLVVGHGLPMKKPGLVGPGVSL